jgi:hypothetical protein
MAAFDDFVLPLVYPPNPNQTLERKPPLDGLRGQFIFSRVTTSQPGNCEICHILPLGTNGRITNDQTLDEDQDFKNPQLRNLYKKTGFTDAPGAVNKRGTGFNHDGSIDNLFDFLGQSRFNFGSPPSSADANRRNVEAFLLAFDTGMAPAVGFQVTFSGSNNADPVVNNQFSTLEVQALSGSCDLVAKGRVNNQPRGWLFVGQQHEDDPWESDQHAEPRLTTAQLLALAAPGSELTITGVPVGSGFRMGVDRDRDGYRDGDELLIGSDPGDPLSPSPQSGTPPVDRRTFALRSIHPNPFATSAEVAFTLGRAGRVDLAVYDVLGREVRSIARGLWLDAGQQTLRWDGRRADGREAPAGAYFMKLATEGGRWTRVIVRIR